MRSISNFSNLFISVLLAALLAHPNASEHGNNYLHGPTRFIKLKSWFIT